MNGHGLSYAQEACSCTCMIGVAQSKKNINIILNIFSIISENIIFLLKK